MGRTPVAVTRTGIRRVSGRDSRHDNTILGKPLRSGGGRQDVRLSPQLGPKQDGAGTSAASADLCPQARTDGPKLG